jgi:hypothetical protein
MKNRAFILLLVILSIVGCNKDKNDEPSSSQSKDFKFVIDSEYFSESDHYTNGWVMIYNKSNELISFIELSNDTTIIANLENSSKTNGYNLHFLLEAKSSYSTYYYMRAITDAKPRTYFLHSIDMNTTILGENEIHITNINRDYSYKAENSTLATSLSFDGTGSIDQYYQSENIFIKKYKENEMPYYKWFPNVSINETIEFDDSEFIPMSDYIDFSFPEQNGNYLTIYSSNDASSEKYKRRFELYNAKQLYNVSSIKYYYPKNVFQDFYYRFGVKYDNGFGRMIQNKGDHPTTYKSINAQNTVSNSSIYSYNSTLQVDSDIDFIYLTWRKSLYQYENKVLYYTVYKPSNSEISYQAPFLPQDIIDLDPDLFQLHDMEFSEIVLYNHSYYDNYSGYLDYIYNEDDIIDYYSKPFNLNYRFINYNNLKETDQEDHYDEYLRNATNGIHF